MTEQSNISIGVIGAGSMAMNVHLPSLKEVQGVHVCAVCDILEERALNAAKVFGIPKSYTLYRQMIQNEKMDAAYVLVQPDQTFRIALDCIRMGLDVFLEKPPGITTFQAETLMRAALQFNRIVQVGFNRRYIPLVRHVLDIMKTSTRITQVEGSFYKHDSAAFYDGCASAFECDTIHVVDTVRWISGGEPVEAYTMKSRVDSDITNGWNSLIRFDNGTIGAVKANYQTGGRVHTFEIHGPNASAFINLGFGKAACEASILFHRGKGTHSISAAGAGGYEIYQADGMKLAGSTENYRYYGFYDSCREFAEAVKTRNQPLTDIKDAVKTMQLIDLLNNSVR